MPDEREPTEDFDDNEPATRCRLCGLSLENGPLTCPECMKAKKRITGKTRGHTEDAGCRLGRCQCLTLVDESRTAAEVTVSIEDTGEDMENDEHIIMGRILMPEALPVLDSAEVSPGFAEPSARMALAPSGWSLAACRAEGVHNFRAPDGPPP